MSVELIKADSEIIRVPLDTQLRRYARNYRRRLRKMAKGSSRLADLLYTYPAAAFVVAGHSGNPLERAQAKKLVEDGAGLRKVGKCLGLPNWTRKLPPETFSDAFGRLPASERFNRQIANLIPPATDEVGSWFLWVVKANALCDEAFALWIARQPIWAGIYDQPDVLVPLAAYVWFSQAEGAKARGLIEKPWGFNISLAKAVEAARSWIVRMLLEDCKGGRHDTGRWFVPQRASGFRIVPLRQPAELADEGRRMNNCVGDYASAVAAGECMIYSVRRGNRHVATLEVKPDNAMNGAPIVAQLLGPHNEEVDAAITRAVHSWMGRQGRYPRIIANNYALAGFDNTRWNELWAPYWEKLGNPTNVGPLRTPLAPIQVHRALEALSYYG